MKPQSEKGTDMVDHGVEVPEKAVADFCRRHHIQRLALFGSVLRDDFRPDSDVDVLVEFEPGRVPGLLRMAGLEAEMGKILGRKVDLRTPAELSRHFRNEVMREAQEQYVATG